MAVPKEKKEQGRIFITNSLEESRLYNIISSENQHIIVQHKGYQNLLFDVFLHCKTEQDTVKNIKRRLEENRHKNLLTSHVFFKDDKHYYVYARSKASQDKKGSLKKYGEKSYEIINLRESEELFRTGRQDHIVAGQTSWLAYYQPQSERVQEGIRIIKVKPSVSDYDHIQDYRIRHKSGRSFPVGFSRTNKNHVIPEIVDEFTGACVIGCLENKKNPYILWAYGQEGVNHFSLR